MSRVDGTLHKCDVQTCGSTEFLPEYAADGAGWSSMSHMDRNGVVRELDFCPAHATAAERLVQHQNEEFWSFTEKGSK